jgi:hypothetical protein
VRISCHSSHGRFFSCRHHFAASNRFER